MGRLGIVCFSLFLYNLAVSFVSFLVLKLRIFAFDQIGKTDIDNKILPQKPTRTARKYWRFHLLSKCACANSIYFLPIRTSIYRMEFQEDWNNGSELCCPKAACAIVEYAVPRHTCIYHKEEITRTLSYIYRNWSYTWMVLYTNRAEWMNGICLIWSRGRHISPSLPIGDDRYLNLSSEKRPTGRNLGGNRSVRRSGTTSRGTVVLVFYLRMRNAAMIL